MLVLSRNQGQSVSIGPDIIVTILPWIDASGHDREVPTHVRIAIEAPPSLNISRIDEHIRDRKGWQAEQKHEGK